MECWGKETTVRKKLKRDLKTTAGQQINKQPVQTGTSQKNLRKIS